MKISEYGLKIKNIEASTLLEYNNGVRDHYEYKNAMFTNSLFKDFLIENGLEVWKEESTRDIICLEFNYGTRSYEDEQSHLKKIAKNARHEYKLTKSFGDERKTTQKRNKRQKIASLSREAIENREKYIKMSNEEVREKFYNEGVTVTYLTYSKKGEIKKKEEIHYKRLFRSTGKAKKGSCMFIRDSLHEIAQNYLYMGIELPEENAPLVEINAYAPLTASGIVGRVKINPKNILVLKDVDRFMTTNVISIETDSNRHCYAKKIDNYSLRNTLFDGQALIDSSIFPDWGNGYILLRHHFCKMAAFCSNIQKFFRDYFGDEYQNATVTDMFGVVHYVKDIELITTDNSMKWLKFDISYDYWCEKVYENNCMFGIVKTAHESKLGEVQRMSYQMVNSLDEDSMDGVVEESVSYIQSLKRDDNIFLDYLRKNANFSNDFDVLIALCENNPEFTMSSYFRDRKSTIIDNYIFNFRNGKVIQDAENLVIVGSPYAMLLYAATGNPDDVDNDPTFYVEDDSIQCYTERFGSGEHLAFFRSPFNSRNNLTYLHNIYSKNLEKYFNFGRQIIAVNMIGTDFQDRNNGSDQDSDSGYTTNQPDIVAHAKRCYEEYPTIVNNIPKDKNIYSNTMDDYARLDNSLARSQTDIGESSNLAQIAQTYACNFTDEKYSDYVCILSVIAQAAIDSAKRAFDIDVSQEIQRIKKDMNVKTNKYPSFWSVIKKGFNKNNINPNLKCPMNYLYNLKFRKIRSSTPTLPMTYFFQKFELEENRKKCKKVEELIEKYSLELFEYNTLSTNNKDSEKYLLLRRDFDDLINDIQKIYISGKYIGLFSWLLDRAFVITSNSKRNNSRTDSLLNKNKSLLVKTLYQINPSNLLKCFSKNM